jgi:hypothetical protein
MLWSVFAERDSRLMATLYDVTVPAINQHLKRIFADRELAPEQSLSSS